MKLINVNNWMCKETIGVAFKISCCGVIMLLIMGNATVSFAQKAIYLNKGKMIPSGNGFVYKANISLGEGYGLIPYQSVPNPSFYFKSEGNIGFLLSLMPISLNYAYNDINANSNSNFIHFSFDVNKFRSLQKEALKKYTDSLNEKLTHQQLLRQSLLKRKFKADLACDSSLYMNGVNFKLLQDSAKYLNRYDTALVNVPSISQKDSIFEAHRILNDSIKLVEKSILRIEQAQTYYKNAIAAGNFFLSPPNQFSLARILSGLKKFEIGRCNPDNSIYLINGVKVKGLTAEYENGHIYWAGTIGKTVDVYNAQNDDGQFNQFIDNLNFLKLSDYSDGKRLMSVKAGYGKKESSHLYLGGLWAAGYSSSYYYAQNQQTVLEVEKNRVYELDGKLVAGGLIVDFVGAKSVVSASNVTIESAENRNNSNRLLNNSSATGKLRYNFSRINLSVEFGGRWAGPFFKSFGVGFINNDNLRYELKSSKSFGRKEKLTIFYRKEQSNLSSYLLTTTHIESFGLTNHYKFNRDLQIHFEFRPTFIRTFSREAENYQSNNISSSTSITYLIRNKKAPGSIGLIYSYNKFSTPILTTFYQSITNNIYFSLFSRLGINNNLTLSEQRQGGEINKIEKYVIEEIRCDWQVKSKLKTTVYLKYSWSQNTKRMGGGMKCTYAVMKRIDASLSIEKFVKSDVISYLKDDYNQYPYNMFLQLKYHW